MSIRVIRALFYESNTVTWADINGDGADDMLCDNDHGDHWGLISNKDGTFSNKGKYLSNWCKQTLSSGFMETKWADLDGDGRKDMICV